MYRRDFLRIAGTAYLTATLPRLARAQASGPGQVSFPQGVASGDPQPDAVLLWTRALPTQTENEDVSLVLQLSDSEDFKRLRLEENLVAEANNDYTVRALIEGLEPGRPYFYRFIATAGGTSRTGRTFTAPAHDNSENFRLAFASCQNYEQGYYGAWSRMISDDLARSPEEQVQFVLHLGDFIYERYRHGPAGGQTFARRLPAFPDGARDDKREWADSLADYRHLYKTYLADPHLQTARARWPFICTWDDHEFSNNGFQHFSHYEAEPKPELERRRRAHQAWFEYIPALVPASEDLQIQRRLKWGKLADIVLTDLRSHRSRPPLPENISSDLGLPMDPVELVEILDRGNAYNDGNPPARLPFGDGTMPNPAVEREPGTMMGPEQKAWFKQTLRESEARWKIWGNSLPALPLRLDLDALPFMGFQASVLTDDAWSGYPGELKELMQTLDKDGISGVVSLSGDHHMQGAATLLTNPNDETSRAVSADFNVTGISSSPQFGGVLHTANRDQSDFLQLVASQSGEDTNPTWNMTLTDGVLSSITYDRTGLSELARWLGPSSANPGLRYVDTDSNGYGVARVSEDTCEVELVTVQPPLQESGPEGSEVRHRAKFSLPWWSPGEQPELNGPEFEGAPPFPW